MFAVSGVFKSIAAAATLTGAVVFDTVNTLTGSGAKLLSFKHAGSEQAYMTKDGAVTVSGVASGSNALSVPAGARLHLNGGSGNEYLYRSSSNVLTVGEGSVSLAFGTGMVLGAAGYGGGNSAWVASHGTGWALSNGATGHSFDASFGANAGYVMSWKKDTTFKAGLTSDAVFEQRPAAAVPSAPSTGSTLFAREISGRTLPWVRGRRGAAFPLQRSFANSSIVWARGKSGANTLDTMGVTFTSTGSAAAPTPAATSTLVSAIRARVSTVGSAANTSYGQREASGHRFHRGNVSGLGGFYIVFRVGFAAQPSDFRFFMGLSSTTTALTAGEPSSVTNLLGIGLDSGDSAVQFMHNDGSGTATKSSSALSKPGTTELWEFSLFCESNGSSVYMRAENLNSGVSGMEYTASSDLPAADLMMGLHLHCNTGPTGGVTSSLDVVSVYAETDF